MSSEDVQPIHGSEPAAESRRDFLFIGTGAVAAVGAAMSLWPFIDSMNPGADVLAIGQIDVDLSDIEPGQRVTVSWRGRPVFIDHRTPARIAQAKADDAESLPDPELDSARVQRQEWLIVVGICTHLGCVPLGQQDSDPLGEFGGWFCPCHGSHYDTSGRIRRGPAPRNLDVPPYAFPDMTMIRIG